MVWHKPEKHFSITMKIKIIKIQSLQQGSQLSQLKKAIVLTVSSNVHFHQFYICSNVYVFLSWWLAFLIWEMWLLYTTPIEVLLLFQEDNNIKVRKKMNLGMLIYSICLTWISIHNINLLMRFFWHKIHAPVCIFLYKNTFSKFSVLW